MYFGNECIRCALLLYPRYYYVLLTLFYFLFIAGAVLLLFVSSAVTLAVPFCMGKVIDIIYTSDSNTMKANLTSVSQALLVIFTLGAVANFGRVYLMSTAGDFDVSSSYHSLSQ